MNCFAAGISVLAFSSLVLSKHPPPPKSVCCSDAIVPPNVFGSEVLSVTAAAVENFAIDVPYSFINLVPSNLTNLNFCNVTITYTHPGQGDTIHLTVWLPKRWNGRFMGTGGGGYETGFNTPTLSQAISLGYSAASTDGGHPYDPSNNTAKPWALVSPGNVNYNLLQDFASVALDDMARMGKAVTASYYGTPPKYSYWNGCSTGGRQGLMMAQRYPGDYDGILAGAPAIYWSTFLPGEYWPQQVMNRLNYYPPACELNALTEAAINACDGLDGLVDGIISVPGLCHFDPRTVVGQSFNCSGTEAKISYGAAIVALSSWTGPRSTKRAFQWYGVPYDATLLALAATTCDTVTQAPCSGVPFVLAVDWIDLFVEKNPAFDITNMSYSQWDDIFHLSINEYDSIIGTDDPDLSAFKTSGSKMISWHGLADPLIPPNGTFHYYDQVMAGDPSAHDYYRLFEAPGVGHCMGGVGAFPVSIFESLVQWVEDGVAPVTLNGTNLASGMKRNLCMYPLVSAYIGGDPSLASSYKCQTSFT